ncbi:MAG: hypothetical protein ACYDDQ_01805 [Vulcanimicrobiaceae bacterium]
MSALAIADLHQLAHGRTRFTARIAGRAIRYCLALVRHGRLVIVPPLLLVGGTYSPVTDFSRAEQDQLAALVAAEIATRGGAA